MAQAKKGSRTPDQWTVFDTNSAKALDGAGKEIGRTHRARGGRSYKLFSDKGVEMPSTEAITFLCDKAFIVLNEDGERVQPMPESAAFNPAKHIELEPGQAICYVEELTDVALLSRATQRPGGERFTKKTPRKTLIEFLHGISGPDHRATAGEASVADDGAEIPTAEMDPAETDKLLEGTA